MARAAVQGIAMLESKAWKERLVGMEQVVAAIKAAAPEAINAQAVLRSVATKPGFKDSNVQVVQKVCAAAEATAATAAFTSRRAASFVIPGLAERLGDIKVRSLSPALK
jgi:cytoskeleton-associated protein 5